MAGMVTTLPTNTAAVPTNQQQATTQTASAQPTTTPATATPTPTPNAIIAKTTPYGNVNVLYGANGVPAIAPGQQPLSNSVSATFGNVNLLETPSISSANGSYSIAFTPSLANPAQAYTSSVSTPYGKVNVSGYASLSAGSGGAENIVFNPTAIPAGQTGYVYDVTAPGGEQVPVNLQPTLTNGQIAWNAIGFGNYAPITTSQSTPFGNVQLNYTPQLSGNSVSFVDSLANPNASYTNTFNTPYGNVQTKGTAQLVTNADGTQSISYDTNAIIPSANPLTNYANIGQASVLLDETPYLSGGNIAFTPSVANPKQVYYQQEEIGGYPVQVSGNYTLANNQLSFNPTGVMSGQIFNTSQNVNGNALDINLTPSFANGQVTLTPSLANPNQVYKTPETVIVKSSTGQYSSSSSAQTVETEGTYSISNGQIIYTPTEIAPGQGALSANQAFYNAMIGITLTPAISSGQVVLNPSLTNPSEVYNVNGNMGTFSMSGENITFAPSSVQSISALSNAQVSQLGDIYSSFGPSQQSASVAKEYLGMDAQGKYVYGTNAPTAQTITQAASSTATAQAVSPTSYPSGWYSVNGGTPQYIDNPAYIPAVLANGATVQSVTFETVSPLQAAIDSGTATLSVSNTPVPQAPLVWNNGVSTTPTTTSQIGTSTTPTNALTSETIINPTLTTPSQTNTSVNVTSLIPTDSTALNTSTKIITPTNSNSLLTNVSNDLNAVVTDLNSIPVFNTLIAQPATGLSASASIIDNYVGAVSSEVLSGNATLAQAVASNPASGQAAAAAINFVATPVLTYYEGEAIGASLATGVGVELGAIPASTALLNFVDAGAVGAVKGAVVSTALGNVEGALLGYTPTIGSEVGMLATGAAYGFAIGGAEGIEPKSVTTAYSTQEMTDVANQVSAETYNEAPQVTVSYPSSANPSYSIGEVASVTKGLGNTAETIPIESTTSPTTQYSPHSIASVMEGQSVGSQITPTQALAEVQASATTQYPWQVEMKEPTAGLVLRQTNVPVSSDAAAGIKTLVSQGMTEEQATSEMQLSNPEVMPSATTLSFRLPTSSPYNEVPLVSRVSGGVSEWQLGSNVLFKNPEAIAVSADEAGANNANLIDNPTTRTIYLKNLNVAEAGGWQPEYFKNAIEVTAALQNVRTPVLTDINIAALGTSQNSALKSTLSDYSNVPVANEVPLQSVGNLVKQSVDYSEGVSDLAAKSGLNVADATEAYEMLHPMAGQIPDQVTTLLANEGISDPNAIREAAMSNPSEFTTPGSLIKVFGTASVQAQLDKMFRNPNDVDVMINSNDPLMASNLATTLAKNLNDADPEEAGRFRVSPQNENVVEDTYRTDPKTAGYEKVADIHFNNEEQFGFNQPAPEKPFGFDLGKPHPAEPLTDSEWNPNGRGYELAQTTDTLKGKANSAFTIRETEEGGTTIQGQEARATDTKSDLSDYFAIGERLTDVGSDRGSGGNVIKGIDVRARLDSMIQTAIEQGLTTPEQIAKSMNLDFTTEIGTETPPVSSESLAMKYLQTLSEGGVSPSAATPSQYSIAYGYVSRLNQDISPSLVSPSLDASMFPFLSPSVSSTKNKVSPSISPSISNSTSISPSISNSVSTSISPSLSLSLSPSISNSVSTSLSPSISESVSLSTSLSPSISNSPSVSVSPYPSVSVSPSPSPSPSLSVSESTSLLPGAALRNPDNQNPQNIATLKKEIEAMREYHPSITAITVPQYNTDFAENYNPAIAGIGVRPLITPEALKILKKRLKA